jgi:RHS repeat-associated protein
LAVASTTNGDGYTTWDYYGDLADPMSPTEVLDSLTTQPAYTSYDDYGNACVTGPSATTFTAAQCTAPSGDTATTHDALGNQTSVTDQTTGNVIDYYYENSSFPTLMTRRVISPSTGTETTRYSFDPDGRLLTTTNPDGTAVTLAYNVNGEVCSQQPTALVFPCGEGPAVAGVSEYVYNDAGERTSMTDNVGAPGATQWAQTTNYTYTTGELTSTTNANSQTISYLYSYAGQVVCVAYPVSSSTSCGTVSSPTTGSTTNTIVTRSYDSSGRLSSVKDWLGNTTSYTYADPWTPTTPTKITYPSSTGLTANHGYDNNDNATSLSVGTSITDAWTYNDDNEVATSKTNSSTSSAVAYNANKRITGAANLAQSTSNDIYTIASNGEITSDAPPSGSATDFSYNTADELCNTNTASILCTTNPTTGSKFASTANGQRGSATPYSSGTPGSSTYYDWNSYGQLCNVSSGSSTSCTSTPSTGTSYAYNGDGLRMTATTTSSGTVTSTTNSAWDSVTGGSIPLNIDDATTTSSGTTNASYVYGDLLFGGTAPVEQITTTSGGATAAFIVANQTGVQGVYGSTGTSLEQALYSAYGKATITGGAVTPFGFQGSYTDSTGLIYLVNRYYDPTTDQFLSIDPDVAQTDQPYVFTNDDPLNAEDPLGLQGSAGISAETKYRDGHPNRAGCRGLDLSADLNDALKVAEVAGIAGCVISSDGLCGVVLATASGLADTADNAIENHGFGGSFGRNEAFIAVQTGLMYLPGVGEDAAVSEFDPEVDVNAVSETQTLGRPIPLSPTQAAFVRAHAGVLQASCVLFCPK